MAAQAEMAIESQEKPASARDSKGDGMGRGAILRDGGTQGRTGEARMSMEPMIEIRKLTLRYGEKLALQDISLDIPKHQVTAFIGPSGCGKSTLLRCLNRLNDLVDGVTISGTIRVGGLDINDPNLEITELRKRIGMVFQKSNPFPKTIYDNVAYGPRIQGVHSRSALEEVVQRSDRKSVV